MTEIIFTEQQEKGIREALTNGEKILFTGDGKTSRDRIKMFGWKLEEKPDLNRFTGKKELQVFNRMKVYKAFDTSIKSLYKQKNNL